MNAMAEAEKIAENSYLKLISRVAMMLAAGIILPAAMWMVKDIMGTQDQLLRSSIETTIKVDALQTQFAAAQVARSTDQQAIGELSGRTRDLEEGSRRTEDTLDRQQGTVDEILRILKASPSFMETPR